MNKRHVSLFFSIVVFLIPQTYLSAGFSEEGDRLLNEGIELFSKGLYEQSLADFRAIIVDPSLDFYHGDAYFWIGKCHMILGRLDDAEKNLEHFLASYPAHVNYPEAYYQKGRLLFLQNQYENSIRILEDFIRQYPSSVFVPNAYFWVGESLFIMGQLEKSSKIFRHIIANYPSSYKFESAKYRLSIIEFKKRENELLKLLKWSHMEAIKTLDDYEQREKTYEQAIAAYQKKLAQAGIDVTLEKQKDYTKAEILDLQEELKAKNEELEKLKKESIDCKNRVAYLEKKLSAIDEEMAAAAATEAAKETMEEVPVKSNEERLYDLKEEAVKLKELLLQLLEYMEGGGS
ncbi:MAG: tetratricopeptide repeat protein [Spirochaetales bacterium]|nr:tetratricopeptide repeat protein [Spirochaetales bacterium]